MVTEKKDIYYPPNDIGAVSFCNLPHADFGKIVNTIKASTEKLKTEANNQDN